jgi:hypothetical protein
MTLQWRDLLICLGCFFTPNVFSNAAHCLLFLFTREFRLPAKINAFRPQLLFISKRCKFDGRFSPSWRPFRTHRVHLAPRFSPQMTLSGEIGERRIMQGIRLRIGACDGVLARQLYLLSYRSPEWHIKI